MKYFLNFCFAFLFTNFLSAQIYPSSCEVNQEIEELYQNDVPWLNVSVVNGQFLPEADDAILSTSISDSIFQALAAVYNVTNLPERDSVIDVFEIHTFPFYTLNSVIIGANNDVAWMQDLIAGNLNTSSPALNETLANYGMTIVGSNEFSETSFVHLNTDDDYNIPAVLLELLDVPDMLYADPNHYIGDGDNIQALLTTEYVELDYSRGWGDCPAGCICHRHWVFRVYADCSVEFMGSNGCAITPTGIDELSLGINALYPNPFKDRISIDHVPEGTNFLLTNSLGDVIKQGPWRNNYISNLGNNAPGIYILVLFDEDKKSTYKIIKE